MLAAEGVAREATLNVGSNGEEAKKEEFCATEREKLMFN